MVTQKCHCMGTMGSPTVPLPQAGAKLVPTVSPSPPRPPLPQHHSQACLSAHHRAVPLLSGAPLWNRGQWGTGCPLAGGPAHRHPRDQGSGARSCAVLTPSSCPRCALGPGRGQSEMSPHVPAEGLSCSPQPFWGASPPPAAQAAVLAAQPLPAPRQSGLRPLTSPPTYSLSWLRGSVLDRAPGRGSQPRSPSGSISPPAPHNWGARPVPAGSTASQPGLPRTTGTAAPVKH